MVSTELPPSPRRGEVAVATGHPLATEAALETLRAGGSALDAAIAADAVMGFIEPMSTGIGGDVMAVVAEGSEIAVLNGSGRAGMAVDPSSVADNGHGFVPSAGGYAVTVPGAVGAWWDLHERYGRLPWGQVFAPAISAATDGGVVGEVGSRLWHRARRRLGPAAEALYFSSGTAPVAGALWRNPTLATTLARVAADGPEVMYTGRIAADIVNSVVAAGGALAAADLSTHRSEWSDPLRRPLGHYEVVTAPPNCQGMVVALAAELLHESGDLWAAQSGPVTVAMAEALDRSFSLALDHVADPAVVDVPSYATLRDMVSGARLHGPMPYGPGTVFTAVAAGDQMVALVSSVCDRFGAGVGVATGGFVLQSRGRGFSLDASHPNALAPGKRPYHTIVPTILLEHGMPVLSIGVVGGIMQPQGQIQILHHVLNGAGIRAAIEAPRFRLLGDGQVTAEPDLHSADTAALAAAGYEVVNADKVDFGGAQAVLRRDGGLSAASDPRRDGVAIVATVGD